MEVIREVVAAGARGFVSTETAIPYQWRDGRRVGVCLHAPIPSKRYRRGKTAKCRICLSVLASCQRRNKKRAAMFDTSSTVKSLQIEAQVLREMAETQILPVILEDLQTKARRVKSGPNRWDHRPIRCDAATRSWKPGCSNRRGISDCWRSKGRWPETDATDDLQTDGGVCAGCAAGVRSAARVARRAGRSVRCAAVATAKITASFWHRSVNRTTQGQTPICATTSHKDPVSTTAWRRVHSICRRKWMLR